MQMVNARLMMRYRIKFKRQNMSFSRQSQDNKEKFLDENEKSAKLALSMEILH